MDCNMFPKSLDGLWMPTMITANNIILTKTRKQLLKMMVTINDKIMTTYPIFNWKEQHSCCVWETELQNTRFQWAKFTILGPNKIQICKFTANQISKRTMWRFTISLLLYRPHEYIWRAELPSTTYLKMWKSVSFTNCFPWHWSLLIAQKKVDWVSFLRFIMGPDRCWIFFKNWLAKFWAETQSFRNWNPQSRSVRRLERKWIWKLPRWPFCNLIS